MSYDEGGTGSAGTYRASDPAGGGIDWSLSNTSHETDRFDFGISSRGVLTFDTSPDYEDPDDHDQNNVYRITVRATDDNGDYDELDVTVTVTNLAPTITSGAHWVDYDEGDTVSVGDYVASDPGGGDISWSLRGIDAGDFRISRSGVLTFDSTPDFENPLDSGGDNEYNITVRASDASGTTAQRDVTVTVTNLPPTITSGPHWIDYDEGDTVSVGDYVASDPGGGDISWSLRGIDAGDFRISRSGVLTFDSTPDFENPLDTGGDNEYNITVRASDASGTTAQRDVTISVTNLAPTITSGAHWVDYDEGDTVSVGDYVASDPGGGDISWSLRGIDAGDFRISRSGVLTFDSTPDFENPLDSGGDNEYNITVRASDASGTTAERNVTVGVVNLPPTITSGPHWIDYDEGDTVSAADYVASDPGGGDISWSLRGIDAGDFRISRSGVLTFDSTPDFENPLDDDPDNDYEITVRASDASGTTAIMNVTVRVINVNELPEVDSDIPDQMMTASVFRIISLQGTFSDPDGDTLTYSASTSASGIATASVNNRDSTLTIAALAAGMATITVTAADRAPGHADRLTISQNFTVTVEPPELPTVTIARHMNTPASVTEGGQIRFTLTASSAPTADLTVNVTVTETDPHLAGRISNFVTGNIPSEITIAVGTTTSDLILDTEDDTLDETDVGTLARVEVGAGYTVGPPFVAVVTIADNDPPPGAPTGLRANGDLDANGNVTLRWNAVAGATSYMVRYTEEDCDSDGVCNPDDGNWDSRTYTAGTTGTVIEANLGGLSEEQLYRVQVQAVIADASGWSDFTLVFPTDSPLGGGTRVATAPFHGYQVKNSQGSHEFRYVVCEESITSSITTSAEDPTLDRSQQTIIRDIEQAVDKWEDTVAWNEDGVSVVSADSYSLPAGVECASRILGVPLGHSQAAFVSDLDLILAGCFEIACWRSHSWEAIPLGSISYGAILLKASYGAGWNAFNTVTGCTFLHQVVVHEAGHAFGIGNGHFLRGSFDQHPINTMHSVMSQADDTDYCEPQAYDIVALMALYQSR